MEQLTKLVTSSLLNFESAIITIAVYQPSQWVYDFKN